MVSRIVPTTGINNCGGRCPLLVHMEDDRIVKITGNKKYPDLLPCIKGLSAKETFLSEERLLYPMKRAGKRGEGKFERITWEEAIDTITDEWIRIRDIYGPQSRYVHYGWGVSACMSGLRAAKRLLALDGGYQDYYNSYSTACCSYTTPFLYGTANSGSSYDTLLDASLIILWAHNPAETRFDNLMYWLKKAKQKGIPFIVVDPRKNKTAKVLQAEWISPRPGTDAALMDAMAYVIFTEKLYDKEFVTEYCQGFTRESMPPGSDPEDSYFDYLLGTKDGIVKNPAWAQEITGVTESEIRNLARRYALAKPAVLMQGYGGQRHTNGEQFTRGGIMLACLTGNVGISGGWASGAGYVHMVEEPVLPPAENPIKELIPVYEWTNALDAGKLKMIFSLAGNALINQHGDINHTRKLLEDESKCEFIVCSDLFLTASAKYADILLPGISMFEGNNIASPWSQGNFVIAVNKVIEPLGEARQEYDWLKAIAKRLGLYQEFTEGHDTVEQWLEYIYNNMKERYPQLPLYEQFKEEGIYRFPDKEKIVAFADKSFATPSGKVEIYSQVLKDKRDSKIPPVPGYVPEREGTGMSEHFPLQLIAYHPVTRAHSVHWNNQKLRERIPQALRMNPEDARIRNITEGSTVKIYNDRGASIVPVMLTEEIRVGTVALPIGAWYTPDEEKRDRAGAINVFTSLESTPLAHGNGQHTNLVEVCRWLEKEEKRL